MLANKKILAIILVISLLFVSCKETSNKEVADKEPKKSKEINIDVMDVDDIDKNLLQVLTYGISGVFNPLFSMTEADKAVSHLMFLPFIGLKANMETDPQNGIVNSVSRLGYNLSFTINDDLNWWDGKPVTAEDVYFSLKVLLHPDYVGEKKRGELLFIVGAKEYNKGLANEIKGIEIVDDKHLNISFESFQDSFYYALDFRPIPSHYYESTKIEDMFRLNTKPMGNGPYKLEDFEKHNFVNLNVNDDFKYKAHLNKISLREFPQDDIVLNMLRGHIDSANIYNSLEAIDQSEIQKNFDKSSTTKNKVIMLRLSNHNGLEDAGRRKKIIDLLKSYKPNDDIKFSNSLISHTNKAFVEMTHEDEDEGEDKESKINGNSLPINLLYEESPYIKKIANDFKEILSEHGYIVTLNEASPYELINSAKRLIDSGRNLLVLNTFDHGYIPDFTSAFSTYGDGKYLFHDLNFDDEIFGVLADRKSDLKNAYKLLTTDINNKNLALGIGNPVVKTYNRKGLRGISTTEFSNWYDFAVWDIVWE